VGSVTLTVGFIRTQHWAVMVCTFTVLATWLGGTAKAEIDPANIMQASAATNKTVFLFAFDKVFISLLLLKWFSYHALSIFEWSCDWPCLAARWPAGSSGPTY
jgi:hypothetical protein